MASDRLEFGSVLERKGSGGKLWLVTIPVILGVFAFVGYGMLQVSKAGSVKHDAEAAQAQVSELRKTVEERDKLLVAARSDEAIQRSAGAAVALFHGQNARARESGVAFAHPSENAVRVYLYGLTAPPEGQEYVLATRTRGGATKALGEIVPASDGSGYLLAREVPDGTTAIELLLRPRGQEGLQGAEPRVSARYPASGERGVLPEVPHTGPARRGRGSGG